VALVIRDHGPIKPGVVPGVIDDQIRSFGACNPTCTDLQISVHQT
jgi:hypothetical protein